MKQRKRPPVTYSKGDRVGTGLDLHGTVIDPVPRWVDDAWRIRVRWDGAPRDALARPEFLVRG